MPIESADSVDLAETAFLGFLTRDIELHPERIEPISLRFTARIAELTEGMTPDPDVPIEGWVAI